MRRPLGAAGRRTNGQSREVLRPTPSYLASLFGVSVGAGNGDGLAD